MLILVPCGMLLVPMLRVGMLILVPRGMLLVPMLRVGMLHPLKTKA